MLKGSMLDGYLKFMRDNEFEDKKSTLKDTLDKRMRTFENFMIVPLENAHLLEKELGRVVVNEFQALPQELAKFTLSNDLVKWYQYRLHTVDYSGEIHKGVADIQEYAIRISVQEPSGNALVNFYYFDLNRKSSEKWVLANNCDLRVNEKNELRIITKESSVAQNKNYKEVNFNLLKVPPINLVKGSAFKLK